jgi:hypothetical protein
MENDKEILWKDAVEVSGVGSCGLLMLHELSAEGVKRDPPRSEGANDDAARLIFWAYRVLRCRARCGLCCVTGG